jgi:hypothetical protein
MKQPLRFQAPEPRSFLRVASLVLAVLGILAVIQFHQQIVAEGLYVTSLRFRAALFASYALVAVLGLLAVLSWTGFSKSILAGLVSFQGALSRIRPAALLIFGALLIALPVLLLGFYGRFLSHVPARLFMLCLFILLGAALLAAWRKTTWINNLVASALVFASVYLAATFLAQVSDFPFSLGWSEISRYYQASFFFDQQVYGMDLPLPVTHPSRYLLQSLPFLISEAPLWLHRLWQALLWIGMPLLSAWVLARRLLVKDGWLRLLFILWTFLYLMQGAVFYHLLPCVFLVLLGFDRKNFWKSVLFVALASVWAGISRVNWVPLPGALAALLYVLEEKPRKSALSLAYLWQPLAYAIGGSLVALASYSVYILISGVEDVSQFGSSFTSALLWERLLPNAAFPLGILLGILLVSAPLFVLLALRTRQSNLDQWRWVGIGALLLVFFVGGLVVSVKIGGGTNLHNMDAYMVLLLVLVAGLAFGQFAPGGKVAPKPLQVPAWLLAALVLVPVFFAVTSGSPLLLPERQVAEDALAQIQSMADEALAAGGEVLFVSQRHLLTFHMIEGVPLMPKYEKLFLMEMAISDNAVYLDEFVDDLDQQRFTLIITDPVFLNIVGTEVDTLAAENNAWVRNVGRPLLCYYEPVHTFSELSIQILKPLYGNKCQ